MVTHGQRAQAAGEREWPSLRSPAAALIGDQACPPPPALSATKARPLTLLARQEPPRTTAVDPHAARRHPRRFPLHGLPSRPQCVAGPCQQQQTEEHRQARHGSTSQHAAVALAGVQEAMPMPSLRVCVCYQCQACSIDRLGILRPCCAQAKQQRSRRVRFTPLGSFWHHIHVRTAPTRIPGQTAPTEAEGGSSDREGEVPPRLTGPRAPGRVQQRYRDSKHGPSRTARRSVRGRRPLHALIQRAKANPSRARPTHPPHQLGLRGPGLRRCRHHCRAAGSTATHRWRWVAF